MTRRSSGEPFPPEPIKYALLARSKRPDNFRRAAWIHPDQSKSDKPIAVPLNTEALAVLLRQSGKHSRYVFAYKHFPDGKNAHKREYLPVKKAGGAAWKKALNRAGITDFRWHDLRHTWATWHVQQGTPLHVLQELGGWSNAEMVKRYGHLSAAHLSEWADKLENSRTLSGTPGNSA